MCSETVGNGRDRSLPRTAPARLDLKLPAGPFAFCRQSNIHFCKVDSNCCILTFNKLSSARCPCTLLSACRLPVPDRSRRPLHSPFFGPNHLMTPRPGNDSRNLLRSHFSGIKAIRRFNHLIAPSKNIPFRRWRCPGSSTKRIKKLELA